MMDDDYGLDDKIGTETLELDGLPTDEEMYFQIQVKKVRISFYFILFYFILFFHTRIKGCTFMYTVWAGHGLLNVNKTEQFMSTL